MERKRKILIHSVVFSPDGVSTAYLYNDIAKRFYAEGYDVTVLTTTPHYNVIAEALKRQPLKKRWGGLYYTSEFDGIPVKHVSQKKYKSTFLRLIGFVYWHILSFFLGLFEKNVDIILSPSPPLTIGVINIALGKLKKSKVIYNVQEIYPDFLIEQRGLTSKGVIGLLKRLERFVYNNSDAVTTIDEVFKNTIEPRFRDPSKLFVIPNFVDTGLYRPLAKEEVQLDTHIFPDDSNLKVMYAGNIGHAQDWEPLIQSAKRLLGRSIMFYIIGEGVLKGKLIKDIEHNQLNNIKVLPYQPREMMPQLLAYADLQFIFMSKEMEGHGFPSKVYTIMAAGKPLIVTSGANTPLCSFLANADCGLIIDAQTMEDKVVRITSILESIDKEQLSVLGKRGVEVILNSYTMEKVTKSYVDLADRFFYE